MTLSTLCKDWNLSETATKIIKSDSFFLNHLAAEKDKFPLPPFYTPNEIEIRINNILILKLVDGNEVYFKKNYSSKPCLIEWRFDDDCAFFQADNQVLINRACEMEISSDIKQKIDLIVDPKSRPNSSCSRKIVFKVMTQENIDHLYVSHYPYSNPQPIIDAYGDIEKNDSLRFLVGTASSVWFNPENLGSEQGLEKPENTSANRN